MRSRRHCFAALTAVAPRRGRAPAGAAAACRRIRADRLLGVARSRRARRAGARLSPKARATCCGSACSTASPRRARRTAAWAQARLCRGRRGDRASADRRLAAAVQPERGDRPDRPRPAHHDRRGRARAGAQCLRPGSARQPVAHPLRHARPRADLDLRPQPLHDRSICARRARRDLLEWRGFAVALAAPLFALATRAARRAGASGCRARRPSSRSRCLRSAPISR